MTASQQRLNELALDLAERTRLKTWHSFVEELQVPSDLMPAIMANRPVLLRLVPPRACSAEEFTVLVNLLAGLLETNQALQEHAAEVAKLAEALSGHLTAFQSVARNLAHLARFATLEEDAS